MADFTPEQKERLSRPRGKGMGTYRLGRVDMQNGMPREHSDDPEWLAGWDSMKQDLIDGVATDSHWMVAETGGAR